MQVSQVTIYFIRKLQKALVGTPRRSGGILKGKSVFRSGGTRDDRLKKNMFFGLSYKTENRNDGPR
jgi:hypothetical protein